MKKFTNPQSVELTETRWHLFITVIDEHGISHEFVASADSYFSEHDHIWFSSRKEWDDYRNE